MPKRHSCILGVILVLYVVLGLAYSTATPIGEGPDEPGHIAYIQYLEARGRLPRHGEVEAPLAQQVKHPPLYYAIGALTTLWSPPVDVVFVPNPNFSLNLEHIATPAMYKHGAAEQWPYAEPYRGLRAVRWLTVLFGLLTVWATFQLAMTIRPGAPAIALGAAASVAFLPQHLFIQGMINNDGLVVPLSALSLWLSARVALHGAARRDCAALGIVLGLGLLTKLTILALFAVAALAVAIATWRARSWKRAFESGVAIAGPIVLVAGWWLAYNLVVNGDLLGWGKFESAASESLRRAPLAADLSRYFSLQFTSFWGQFGWVSVPLPGGVYGALGAITFAAAVGFAMSSVRWLRGPRKGSPWIGMALVAAAAALVYASIFRLAFTFDLVVAQGRYLFVGLPAFAGLFATGIAGWFPQRDRAAAMAALGIGMLALAVWSLAAALAPAYRPPPRLDGAAIAAIRTRVDADFGPAIRLVGYDLDRTRFKPGETVHLPLYWTAQAEPEDGYWQFAQVIDATGRVVGQVDRLPLDGRYPTISWLPGRVFRDAVDIAIDRDATPGRASIIVGLYPEGWPMSRAPATRAGHALGDAFHIEPLVIEQPHRVDIDSLPVRKRGDMFTVGSADSPHFSPGIRLLGYTLDHAQARPDPTHDIQAIGVLTVTLYWRQLQGHYDTMGEAYGWVNDSKLDVDYTVFVHLSGPDGRPIATADGPPQTGRYPTSLWSLEEVVEDVHLLRLPEDSIIDDLTVRVGLYDPATGVRLAAWDGSEKPWPDGEVVLGGVDGGR